MCVGDIVAAIVRSDTTEARSDKVDYKGFDVRIEVAMTRCMK